MKNLILIVLFLIIANSVFGGPRVYLDCWYDDYYTLGIVGNASASNYQNMTTPNFYSLAIMEISIFDGDFKYNIPITAANGFARSGPMQMLCTVQSGDTVMKEYNQNYTINGKTMNLLMRISRTYSNGSGFALDVRSTYPNGAPSEIGGYSTASGLGITLRCDYDFYNYLNRAGLDGAGWRPLTAYSDNSGQGWNVSACANDSVWWNSGFRVLARFFDSDWRSISGPVWNIQWVDGWPSATKHLLSFLRGFVFEDYPVFYDDYCSPNIQTLDTGGYSRESQFSAFVPAGGGSDMGAFMTSIDPSPSQTGNFYSEIYLCSAAQTGSRSINLAWKYYDDAYGNTKYKAFGDSVPRALRKLLWGSGSQLTIAKEKSLWLKCNYYNDSNNLCTFEELFAMEYDRYSGQFNGRFDLNTAVYVLASDQGFYDDPDHTGGVTVSVSVGYSDDSSTSVKISRAFVFPRASIHTGWGTPMVYFCIAHELGHTFGMSHQWSNCTYAQGWDCPNGTIMSYSSSPIMDYGPDAKTWFNKAPDNWVQPVCGSGPMDELRYVNGIHTYDLKVNDIIDW
jgi:hypothetical protein